MLKSICSSLAVIVLCGAAFAADDKFVLADFERDADKMYEQAPDVTIVAEHAKSGTHSLKVVQKGGGYPGIRFEKPEQLKHFTEFPNFRMEVFNPQDQTVTFTASAGDAKSTNYGTRYNNDGLAAKPGWSTLQINLTGLTRSSSNNFLERGALDMSTLKFFTIFLVGDKPATLYFDDPRLEGDGLPKVEGLRAFAFAPSTAGVFAGFTGVNEKSKYSTAAGFGWEGAVYRHSHPGNPDDLAGNYGAGDAFVADLKSGPGTYVVNISIDTFGEWATPQHFETRAVELNGKTVLDEKIDADTFMKTRYLRFEDDEDTPGMDLWERRVKVALPLRTFEAEVGADGKLNVKVRTSGGWAGLMSYLIVYPKAKDSEGKAFLAALDKLRKDAFNNNIVLSVPKPDNAAPKASAEEMASGYIPFVRSTEENINCNSAPMEKERGAALALYACPGERIAGQIGMLPLTKVDGVKLTVSDLSGANGKIPSSAVTLRKIRNFAKRDGQGNSGIVVPMILQPFDTLSLAPGMTRGIWLTIKIADDAAAGDYTGTLKIDGGGKSQSIPIKLTVYPFTLDKADDITISCTGTTAGHWRGLYKDLEERWWKVAEEVMRDQAEHGMNAVTGGPGMALKSVKDGKAEIDFSETDRWLALAVKYGLTKRGDSYQGLDVNIARTQNKDCVATNEANAKKSYNIGFGELLKIVYGAIEAHAKENHWPPRSYALLDEPRPEFGNIESAKQLIEVHIQNAPETKFSGFYSPGQGRDPYFKLMPITIAHHTEESIKACVDAGKEAWTYTGGGARCDIGRWLFVAHSKGLTGFLRNGYQYVNSDAYYDFSDTEGSWAQVYPSKNGIAATTGWERTAEGVNDYRYLKTLRARIDAARKAGAHKAEADAAEAFLTESLKPITLADERTAELKAEEWSAFRSELAKHINALK